VREVRVAVATILEKTLDSALFYQDKLKSLHQLLEVLLALLDKDVPENCKNCAQYFFLFNTFVQKQGIRAGDLLLRHSALRHMTSFLLGANRQNNQVTPAALWPRAMAMVLLPHGFSLCGDEHISSRKSPGAGTT